MKKRLVEILLFMCLAGSLCPAHAFGFDSRQLIDYLNKTFPDQQQLVADISAYNENRIAFPETGVSLEKGRELVILRKQADTPFYLLPATGVLQVDGRISDSYIARQIATWVDKEPEAGDPIVIPSSPTIYLYANIENRDGFAPYQELLRKLVENHYDVIEIQSHEFKPEPGKYGVVLRLEGVGQNLVIKLQSLYTRATMFSDTYAYASDFQVTVSAGKQIMPLESAPAVASGGKMAKRRPAEEKKDFREVEARPEPRILRLPENFQRLVICQLDETEEPEFVLLNNNKIQVFHRRSDGLQPVYTYEFKTDNLAGLHLHAIDLTGDGRAELAVTLGQTVNRSDARTTYLNSMILGFRQNQLQPLAENLPYYLRAVADPSGKPVLLGQKIGEYAPYSGNIFKIRIKADEKLSATVYDPASAIYSLYQFNFLPGYPEHVMIIEPSGHISVYNSRTETIKAVSDTRYGSFTVVSYPIKLKKPEFRGGFEKKTAEDHFAPRRFLLKSAYDGQLFTIDKQRQTTGWDLNKLKQLFSDQKAQDSLVAVKWTGQSIRQTWESETFSKDILDFSFMTEQEKDNLFLLVKDNQGFALQPVE